MGISVERKFRVAKSLERKGEISQALFHYQDVAKKFPINKRAQKEITRLKEQLRDPSAAAIRDVTLAYSQCKMQLVLEQTEGFLGRFPNAEPLWTLRGAAATALGQHDLAQTAFSQSVKLRPDLAKAHANLGASFQKQRKTSESIACYSTAIDLQPETARHYLCRGNAYRNASDMTAAIADLRTNCKLDPKNAMGFVYLGQALRDADDIHAASTAFASAVHLDPGSATAQRSLGSCYLMTGDIQQALSHLKQAVVLDPTSVAAHSNLGSVQFLTQQFDAALRSCTAAITLDPKHAKSYQNLGNVHHMCGRLDQAVAAYDTAVTLDGSLNAAQALKLHFQAQMCEWSGLNEFATIADSFGIGRAAVAPWPMLGFEDNPARQKLRSARYAEQWEYKRPEFARRPEKARLRVGYVSSDLSEHATLFLLNGVLEHHNRSDFEIFVYCLNEPKQGPQFDRMLRNTEHFVDVHRDSDDAIIQRARQDQIDIAIDLKGYTQDARPGLFFAGLAPIQINYLGYPGTMATPSMDYMIADETVVPPKQRQHYSEHMIYLPDSYQPNDNQRAIAQTPPSRHDCGLPDDAVVMCCFNSSYKISSQEFDIWMRVLKAVPGSVLWLMDCNKWAKQNLQQAARDRGVDDSRLVFAANLPHDAHLARHQLADVFVDTFNVNAHTSASDALWAGLPVVTMAGSQFAARVAASLLNAVGLPDLVTQDAQQYEALITRLVTDKPGLAQIKSRLDANRLTHPLFDTASYTTHLEQGYRKVWQRWQQGDTPEDVHL